MAVEPTPKYRDDEMVGFPHIRQDQIVNRSVRVEKGIIILVRTTIPLSPMKGVVLLSLVARTQQTQGIRPERQFMVARSSFRVVTQAVACGRSGYSNSNSW